MITSRLFGLVIALLHSVTLVCGMHIRIEYGHFENLTCYTCPEKRNNEECNSWAPNIPCPMKHTVCKTVHHIHRTTGASQLVDKMCALPEQCTAGHIGCHDNEDGELICTSCCNKSFCNVAVPYNVTTSVELSAILVHSNTSHVTSSKWEMVVLLVSLLSVYFCI